MSVGEAASEPDGPLRVVVWSDRGRTVGLVVGGIVDVVEESLAVDASRARPGVLGSAIVRHRVTEILDVPAIVGAAEAA